MSNVEAAIGAYLAEHYQNDHHIVISAAYNSLFVKDHRHNDRYRIDIIETLVVVNWQFVNIHEGDLNDPNSLQKIVQALDTFIQKRRSGDTIWTASQKLLDPDK